MIKGTCSIDDCPFDELWIGLCRAHYARGRRLGDPLKGRATLDGLPMLFVRDALAYHGPDCIAWPFWVIVLLTSAMVIGTVVIYGVQRAHLPSWLVTIVGVIVAATRRQGAHR